MTLFPKENKHILITIITEVLLMLSNLVGSLFELIPFIRIMDKYVSKIIF